jgi:hypothetical protein
MITNDQLAAGAVTTTKLSKNLRLPHVNLVKANMGDVLVAAPNGDFVTKQLKGAVLMEDTGMVTLELGHLYKQLKKLGVVFQEDFTRPNTMLYAKRAGQPKALDLNELKIQLGIPNTFSSAELDVGYTGTTDQVKTYTADLIWNTATTGVTYAGSGGSIVATVTHGLGTSNLIASVLDLNSSTSTYLRLMDIGFDTFVKVINDDTITISFDFDSSSLPTYKLTLIKVS